MWVSFQRLMIQLDSYEVYAVLVEVRWDGCSVAGVPCLTQEL